MQVTNLLLISMQRTSPTAPATTAQTFVKFTCELVSYGLLEVLGMDWQYPHVETEGSRFEAIVGIAAVVFRERHEEEFAQNIADYEDYVLESVDTTMEYLRRFVRKNFKGRVPLMEFIVYCAFLVDLTVCCFEEGMVEYIVEIVEETYDVYEQHMESYFHVVGGWHALGEVAKQYVEFVEAMTSYDVLAGSKETRTSADEHCGSRTSSQRIGTDGNGSNDDSNMDSASVVGEIRAVAADDEPCFSGGVKASHTSITTLGMNVGTKKKCIDINDSADGNGSNDDSNMDDVSVVGEIRAGAVHDDHPSEGGNASRTNALGMDGGSQRKASNANVGAERNDLNVDSDMDVSANGANVNTHASGSRMSGTAQRSAADNSDKDDLKADSDMDVRPKADLVGEDTRTSYR